MTSECPRCRSRLVLCTGNYANNLNCTVCSMVFNQDTGKSITHKILKLREDLMIEHLKANGREVVTTEIFCEKT